jgi:hypothetical protein
MEYLKNHTSASRINNESGVLLIEVIISVGIAGILMLSLLSMMQLVNQNSSRVSLGVSKNELINRIRNNAILLQNIESSAKMTMTLGTDGLTPNIGTANNMVNFRALADCLPSVGTTGTCNKTSMDDARGFRFYLSNGVSEDPTKATAGEDVYYTFSGVRCDQTKAATPAECPIMAQAWAEPFCNGFATSCNKAISLTIRYRVALRTDFTGNALMAPIEGEVYLPLTKGIQLSRLLSQSDNSLTMNSSGIYTVQKYYGLSDQASQPTGLRFEAILGNPTGLNSMRLQYRALTGTAAQPYLDDTIPATFNSPSDWTDVPDPATGTGQWSVDLTGAKANQIINFGTQSHAGTNIIISKNFKIGASLSDTLAEQAKYRWTYNASNVLTAPTFKSGIYQFRVLATDISTATIESMNYITVRIVSRPQVFTNPPAQPLTNQNRNCISAQKDINYNIAIADDEGIDTQNLKLNGTNQTFTAVTGTSGVVSIPFDLSVASGSFIYDFTAANSFTNRTVNSMLVPPSSGTLTVNLTEKTMSWATLSSTPGKIRINTNGTVTASISAGSCCSINPTTSWTYPPAADPLLSGPTSAASSCGLDTSTNTRTCTANVTVLGIKENSTPPTNVSGSFNFGTSNTACLGTHSALANIPVVRIPGIQFYITESLWIDLPTTPTANTNLKSKTPKVYVDIDFDPDETVTIAIYKTIDGTEICQLTFNAGSGTASVRKECNIPASYSGKLSIKRITPNIQNPTDLTDPSYRAKLNTDATKIEHTTCQTNIQNIPKFANFTVGSSLPMTNSPYGYNASNVQDPYNDTGLWSSGTTKNFRCYDGWRSVVAGGSVNNMTLMPNSGCAGTMIGNSSTDFNKQDSIDHYRYLNSSPKPWWCPATLTSSIGNSAFSSSWSRYNTYIFPDNPYLDFDPLNGPYAFVVWHNGAPSNAVWQYNSGVGAASNTPPKGWDDYTSTLCNGDATLTKIKLYGTKTVGHSAAETVMKATNNVYTTGSGGFFSYYFMCSFGRWNPANKTETSWSH